MHKVAVGSILALSISGLVGGLTACGGGGSTHTVTSADMTTWQTKAKQIGKQTPAIQNLKNSDKLLADCHGTARDVRKAIDSIPNPPYRGQEWRNSSNATLKLLDETCKAIDSLDLNKLDLLQAKETATANLSNHWVDEVNQKFPDLNWPHTNYLGQ